MPEIHKGKWLDKIPFIVRYKSKKAVKEMLEECIGKGELSQEPCTVIFDKIGWLTHPKYGAMFLFSNGAMTEHGFRTDICSTKEILEEKFLNAKKRIMNDGVISKEIYDRLSWEKMANYGILMFTTEKTMGTVRRRCA